jgi:beta-lactamase regulating signal transducer with metallopeptidase domain
MNTTSFATFLEQVAQWAWSASLAAAIPALILLSLGYWKSFPVRGRMLLTVAVALRLVLPAVPSLPGHPLQWWQSPVAQQQAMPDTGAFAITEATVSPWIWLWLAGVVAVLGWTVISHALLKRRLAFASDDPGEHLEALLTWCCQRARVNARIDFRLVHGLSTPAIYGWRTPMLLLPADLETKHSDDEIRGMMLHELEHIRKGDGFWNWAALVVCALHWFNPLVWLCLRRYHADREILCDRRALALLSPQQRHAYGHALLKTWETASLHQPALLTPFLRRRSETYTRILMSIQPNRPRRLVQLLAIVMVPALSLVSLTTARADREPGKKPAETEEGKREGEDGKSKSRNRRPRDGEGERKGPRDGEGTRKGPRDGEGERKGPRDGEAKKTGPRDGEAKRTGPRDGEGANKGPRDGEGVKREGDKN